MIKKKRLQFKQQRLGIRNFMTDDVSNSNQLDNIKEIIDIKRKCLCQLPKYSSHNESIWLIVQI